MRSRYLFLFAILLSVGCRTLPSGTVCDCLKTIRDPFPTAPSDPAFVTARRDRVACFLQLRGAQLTNTTTAPCDLTTKAKELEDLIRSDVTNLNEKRRNRKELLASAPKQADFLKPEVASIEAALNEETPYIGETLLVPAESTAQTKGPQEERRDDKKSGHHEDAASGEKGRERENRHDHEDAVDQKEDHGREMGHDHDEAGEKEESADHEETCDCQSQLPDFDAQLSRHPNNPRFRRAHQRLAKCLTSVRKAALQHYDGGQAGPDDREPCDKRFDALEAIAVTETKKLIAQRDSVTKELGARDKNDEGALVDQLHEIKQALSGLEPFVTVAGSDVTVKEGDFQARRKAHEAKQAAAAQEARCSSRFAYLEVGTEPDPKGLMACVESMRSLCRAPKGLSVNQCELSLSRLEQNLREYAATQSDQLLKLKKAHDSLIGDDKKKNDDEQKALNERLADIRKLVVIPDEGDLSEYSDYKQWWSKLSFGYEYVNLNNAFSKGFPEFGVTVGLNLPRQAVPDVSLQNWHLLSYGVFTTFAAALTNTAEQTKTSLTTPSAFDEGAQNALSVEEQIFWPWWRSDLDPQDRRLRTWLGPIFSAGGRKTDKDSFLSPRFYGGLRLARSPEFYSDFMFGRSSGLRSHRLEVRGQYPIFRFENRSRLILGAIGNFGVNKRKREAICIPDPDEPPLPVTRTCAEPDVIRIYLRYDITAETLKKIFGGEK